VMVGNNKRHPANQLPVEFEKASFTKSPRSIAVASQNEISNRIDFNMVKNNQI